MAKQGYDLVYDQDAFKTWLELSQDARKLKAARALNEKDLNTLWDMTEAYLLKEGQKGSRVSDLTLRAYRFALQALLTAWAGKSLLRASQEDALLYVRELERGHRDPEQPERFLEKPRKQSTLIKRVTVGKHFYEALRWCGLYRDDNPFEGISLTRDTLRAEDKREAYSLQDTVNLFRHAAADEDLTDMLIILLTVVAGLRVSEIVALTWEQVDDSQWLIQLEGKGRKVRFVPLADLLAVTLKTCQATRQDDLPQVLVRRYRGLGPFSDAGLRYRIDQLCKRVFGGTDPKTGKGLGYKALHAFRHTFGTEMHKLIPLFDLSRILGHSDIKTTAIYGMSSSRDAAARALGQGRQRQTLEEWLLKLRDEKVNALGIILFLSLDEPLRNVWQQRASRHYPGMQLDGFAHQGVRSQTHLSTKDDIAVKLRALEQEKRKLLDALERNSS